MASMVPVAERLPKSETTEAQGLSTALASPHCLISVIGAHDGRIGFIAARGPVRCGGRRRVTERPFIRKVNPFHHLFLLTIAGGIETIAVRVVHFDLS